MDCICVTLLYVRVDILLICDRRQANIRLLRWPVSVSLLILSRRLRCAARFHDIGEQRAADSCLRIGSCYGARSSQKSNKFVRCHNLYRRNKFVILCVCIIFACMHSQHEIRCGNTENTCRLCEELFNFQIQDHAGSLLSCKRSCRLN